MTINQLTGSGILPQLPSSSPAAQKLQVIDATTSLPVLPLPSDHQNNNESELQIRNAVEKIQTTVDNLAHNLLFSIDKDSGKTIIKVVDAQTEEVIRQIPTKEIIQIDRALDKVQGLLFNGKA